MKVKSDFDIVSAVTAYYGFAEKVELELREDSNGG